MIVWRPWSASEGSIAAIRVVSTIVTPSTVPTTVTMVVMRVVVMTVVVTTATTAAAAATSGAVSRCRQAAVHGADALLWNVLLP